KQGGGMRTVYVTQPGAVLRRDGGLLRVWTRAGCVARVSMHDLAQIVLMGSITLTPAALDLMLERGVDVVFITMHGRYRGRIVRSTSANIRLRLAQYRCLTGPTRVLPLGRELVRAKTHNMRTLLLRWMRRHGSTPALLKAARSMQATMSRLELVGTLDAIRGCEGAAAAAYFRGFGYLVVQPGFQFGGR